MSTPLTDRLALASGLAIKVPARVATDAPIVLSGEQVIDGVQVYAESQDRVLVKNQVDARDNGIYQVNLAGWSRVQDADGNRDLVNGTLVLVAEGQHNASFYQLVTDDSPVVIGTSEINFVPAAFASQGQYIDLDRFAYPFIDIAHEPLDPDAISWTAARDSTQALLDCLEESAATGVPVLAGPYSYLIDASAEVLVTEWAKLFGHGLTTRFKFHYTNGVYPNLTTDANKQHGTLGNFTIETTSGSWRSNANSMAIRVGRATGAEATINANPNVELFNIYGGDGYNRIVYGAQECDNSKWHNITSFSLVGRAYIEFNIQATNREAPWACGQISGCHLTQVGGIDDNLYGILIIGTDSIFLHSNIVNNCHVNYSIESPSDGSMRENTVPNLMNCYSEEQRSLWKTAPRYAASTLHTAGVYYKPPQSLADGSLWLCTATGTTSGTLPSFGASGMDVWGTSTFTNGGASFSYVGRSVAFSMRGERIMNLVCPTTAGHYVAYEMRGNGRMNVTTPGVKIFSPDHDVAFCTNQFQNGKSFAKFSMGSVRGNFRPYRVSPSDGNTCQIVLEYCRGGNDVLGHLPTDGLGLYRYMTGMSTAQHAPETFGGITTFYGPIVHPLVAAPNLLINGQFGIDSRNGGASTAVADDAYCFDSWYILTQTASVNVSKLTDVDTNKATALRITQNQASAQRFGLAQILESAASLRLNGQPTALSARVRCSASTTIRYAIISSTATADAPTSDVVNDWTSTTYTAGNFFIASVQTVETTGSTALTANTWTDITPLLESAMATAGNNAIVFLWTDSAQAQNVTLDFAWVKFEQSTYATPFIPELPAVEKMRCQRFYQRRALGYYWYATNAGQAFADTITFPVFMHSVPALSVTGGTQANLTSTSFNETDNYGTRFSMTATATGDVSAYNMDFVAKIEL